MGPRVRPEEAGNAICNRGPIRQLFVEFGKKVAETPSRTLLHPFPEFAQTRHPVFRGVAGDEGGVEGADGGADEPVGSAGAWAEALIAAGLIRAEPPPPLQPKNPLTRLDLSQRS